MWRSTVLHFVARLTTQLASRVESYMSTNRTASYVQLSFYVNIHYLLPASILEAEPRLGNQLCSIRRLALGYWYVNASTNYCERSAPANPDRLSAATSGPVIPRSKVVVQGIRASNLASVRPTALEAPDNRVEIDEDGGRLLSNEGQVRNASRFPTKDRQCGRSSGVRGGPTS
jgi:hypothetical protein